LTIFGTINAMRKNLLILALSIILIPILNGCSKDDADFKKRCEEAEIHHRLPICDNTARE
jgi:hypothetical protein